MYLFKTQFFQTTSHTCSIITQQNCFQTEATCSSQKDKESKKKKKKRINIPSERKIRFSLVTKAQFSSSLHEFSRRFEIQTRKRTSLFKKKERERNSEEENRFER